MNPERVFKRYDIRGKYPEEIDEEFAKLLGHSIAKFVNEKDNNEVVVCKDNKESSETLKESLISGLQSAGLKVFDAGTGPTDYAAWSGKKKDCVSVQVTSSHMPLDFNGFKLMYSEGNGFVNEDLDKIEQYFGEKNEREKGKVIDERGLFEEYVEDLKSFAGSFNHPGKKKIVIDDLGGTGQFIRELLEDEGNEVISVSEDESPKVDPPDPRPENLQKLAKRVDSEDADLGLAFDLDADRIRVYRDGEFVSGDEVFAILASETDGKTVASVNTASEIENMTEVEYTRVGDPFVLDRALEIDAELAGEPNGHYAFPEFLPYNSAALTALILSRIDLEKAFGQLEDFEIARESLKVESKEKVIEELKEIHGDEIVSEVDGIKFGMEDSTVLVRPSGSSSKVRITADSGGEASAERILEEVKEEVKSIETQ